VGRIGSQTGDPPVYEFVLGEILYSKKAN